METIQRNGKQLLGLINDILDLSKIEAGKMDVEAIPCAPVQLVAEVQSLMRVRADAKGLPLEIEFVGPIPETITTDSMRLKQILVNLIGNALKFTEAGRVRLVTRLVTVKTPPPSRAATHSATASGFAPDTVPNAPRRGAALQFEVIDTGIGMTPEQSTRIFEPFRQADGSTTRRFGGSGLGLTISKCLTEALGGTITVASQLGVGSTFTVTVATGSLDGVRMLDHPAEALTVKPSMPDGARSADLRLDCRILLAEDGPDNQRLIAYLLNKAGAAVTVVENGQLAVEAVLQAHEQALPFDVILMDMQMPVLDGYEATRLLREQGYTGPIIALTAHAMDGDRAKCLAAGCNDYAAKPIDRRKLIGSIQAYVVQPSCR
jgi:CheY-like chemotaxis protein